MAALRHVAGSRCSGWWNARYPRKRTERCSHVM